MNYLDGLNDAQRAAVENTQGPSMVIAGAGSGKTRVLTFRIAHLIKQGVDPFNILSLTFTNKAAREMKERISTIVGESEAQNIWMGTFHSVFAKILRIESELIGYPRNFTIYDTSDAKSLIKTILKEEGLDDKIYKPGLVLNRISSAKNNLISARAYANNTSIIAEDRQSAKPKLAEVYLKYEQRCFKAGAMDFDDLLFKTNVLLRDHPDVLRKYQHKFKYILVDEYQDTNYSQYLIVKKMAALNENLCVVGDDAQSIYAFRGANIQNILNFKRDYPDYKLFKLEQNYRSTKVIVKAANSIIKNNKEQIEKNVWTSNSEGDRIKVLASTADSEESRKVARLIYDTKNNEGAKHEDFAILYRTNAQSRSFEEAFRKLNIPYKIYGGLSFYQRKEIKDLLSYYRLIANNKDEEALKRIINYPKRGIGQTSIDKAVICANANNVSLWDVVSNVNKFNLEVNNGTKTKMSEFSTMIKSFGVQLDKKDAYDLAKEIAATSGILKEHFADKSPEGISRHENVEELLNGIKEFSESSTEELTTLSDFMVDVALLTDVDNEKDEDKDKVVLMTIHASKGLEFPYIYIVGLEENLFPSQLSINSRDELEEERRLFYVAVTRAEKQATLSYATSRYRWGNLQHSEKSRFIDEIDPQFLDQEEAPEEKSFSFDEKPWGGTKFSGMGQKFAKRNAPTNKFKSSPKKTEPKGEPKIPLSRRNLKKVDASSVGSQISASDLTKLAVGANVKHEKFGKGKVLSLEGNAPNTKCTVFFPSVGQKQLLLKFAKLEIM